MHARRRTVPATVVVLSAIILSGCHSRTRVAVPDSTPPPPNSAVFAQLKPGDNVRVTLRTGEKVTFTLAEVQPDALVAKDGRHFAFRDMTQLDKRHLSPWKTVGLAVGIFVVWFVAMAVSFGP
jgi:hypothetical protein